MDVLIRNLADPVHAELVRRAALADKSVAGYVRDVLARHVEVPSIEDWLRRVEDLPRATGTSGRTGADWMDDARVAAGDDLGPGSRSRRRAG